jgi:Zn-dependent peptidase ImmA (M78 family)
MNRKQAKKIFDEVAERFGCTDLRLSIDKKFFRGCFKHLSGFYYHAHKIIVIDGTFNKNPAKYRFTVTHEMTHAWICKHISETWFHNHGLVFYLVFFIKSGIFRFNRERLSALLAMGLSRTATCDV